MEIHGVYVGLFNDPRDKKNTRPGSPTRKTKSPQLIFIVGAAHTTATASYSASYSNIVAAAAAASVG